jgi:hypothetical protein
MKNQLLAEGQGRRRKSLVRRRRDRERVSRVEEQLLRPAAHLVQVGTPRAVAVCQGLGACNSLSRE